MMVSKVIELVFEIHAGGDVSLFPKDVDHFAPPANPRVAGVSPGPRNDLACQAKEHRRVGHRVPDKPWQQLIGVDDGELSSGLGGFDVHAFRFEPRAKSFPVRRGRHQNDAFAIGDCAGRESTDCAVEEVLILIKLDDMIARPCARQKPRPRLWLREVV